MKSIEKVNVLFVRESWVDTASYRLKKNFGIASSTTTTCCISSCFFRFPAAAVVKGDLVLIKIRFHAARTGCEQDFPEASRTQSVGMRARMGEGGVVVMVGGAFKVIRPWRV